MILRDLSEADYGVCMCVDLINYDLRASLSVGQLSMQAECVGWVEFGVCCSNMLSPPSPLAFFFFACFSQSIHV